MWFKNRKFQCINFKILNAFDNENHNNYWIIKFSEKTLSDELSNITEISIEAPLHIKLIKNLDNPIRSNLIKKIDNG